MANIKATPDKPRQEADYPGHLICQYDDGSGRLVYSWVVVTEPDGPLKACYGCDYPEHPGVPCWVARRVAQVLEAMKIIRRRVV